MPIRLDNKIPRFPLMTTAQREAITAPWLGMIIFDTTEATYYFYDGEQWNEWFEAE